MLPVKSFFFLKKKKITKKEANKRSEIITIKTEIEKKNKKFFFFSIQKLRKPFLDALRELSLTVLFFIFAGFTSEV